MYAPHITPDSLIGEIIRVTAGRHENRIARIRRRPWEAPTCHNGGDLAYHVELEFVVDAENTAEQNLPSEATVLLSNTTPATTEEKRQATFVTEIADAMIDDAELVELLNIRPIPRTAS